MKTTKDAIEYFSGRYPFTNGLVIIHGPSGYAAGMAGMFPEGYELVCDELDFNEARS